MPPRTPGGRPADRHRGPQGRADVMRRSYGRTPLAEQASPGRDRRQPVCPAPIVIDADPAPPLGAVLVSSRVHVILMDFPRTRRSMDARGDDERATGSK